jgi:hypothetical protein
MAWIWFSFSLPPIQGNLRQNTKDVVGSFVLEIPSDTVQTTSILSLIIRSMIQFNTVCPLISCTLRISELEFEQRMAELKNFHWIRAQESVFDSNENFLKIAISSWTNLSVFPEIVDQPRKNAVEIRTFHDLTIVAHFANISWCVHIWVFTASTIWKISRMRMTFVYITSAFDVRYGCSLTVMPQTFPS